jgi:hypothetical protein
MSKQGKAAQIIDRTKRLSVVEWSQIISGFLACIAAFCALYAANKANLISERIEFANERNSCISDLVKSTDSLKDGLYGLIKVLARGVAAGHSFDPQGPLEKASEVGALFDQFDADLRKHGCNREISFSEGLALELENVKQALKQNPTENLKLEPLLTRLNELESKKIYRTCCPSSL